MEALILAAGESKRAGTCKMAVPLKGKPLLQCNIESFIPFCQRIIVVSGAWEEQVKDLLEPYPLVELVHNRHYRQGMFRSIQCGAALCWEDFFLCPGDYPAIKPATLEALSSSTGDIRVPVFQGKKGHPLYLKKVIKKLLLKEDSRYNLRDFTRSRGMTEVSVEDSGILEDLDTPGDFLKFNGTKI